jgi:hypothetical protein
MQELEEQGDFDAFQEIFPETRLGKNDPPHGANAPPPLHNLLIINNNVFQSVEDGEEFSLVVRENPKDYFSLSHRDHGENSPVRPGRAKAWRLERQNSWGFDRPRPKPSGQFPN